MKNTSATKRFVTMVVDYVLLPLPVAVCVAIVMADYLVAIGAEFEALYGIAQLVWVIHIFLGELLFGRTLGKLVTGTKVVSTNSENLRYIQVFVRTLVRAFPIEMISFLGKNPIGWHDSLSKTMVVDATS
jgi:uncharacterized RDD family membrane protein YckC